MSDTLHLTKMAYPVGDISRGQWMIILTTICTHLNLGTPRKKGTDPSVIISVRILSLWRSMAL